MSVAPKLNGLAGRLSLLAAFFLLSSYVWLLPPIMAAEEKDKGFQRQQMPAENPPGEGAGAAAGDEKIPFAQRDAIARLQICAAECSQLAARVEQHILEHLKAADSLDVETFRLNDDRLNDLYDRFDANILEWQSLAESSPDLMPAAAQEALAVSRRKLKIAKLSSYKSSAIFYLCFGQPLASAHCARLALNIAEANDKEKEKDKIADILFYLGAASFWSGDYQAAEGQLKRVLELSPDNAFAAVYLGEAYIAGKKLPQAIGFLTAMKKRAQSDEGRGYFDRALAIAYTLSKQNKLARRHSQLARAELDNAAAKQFPGVAAEALGVVAALNGEYELAERKLSESLVMLKASPIKLGNRLEAAQAALWRCYCRSRLKRAKEALDDRIYAMSFSDEAGHLAVLGKTLDPLFSYEEPAAQVSEAVPDKWALIVGLGSFLDPAVPRLRYPAKDARDIETYLLKEAGFKRDHVRILTDSAATRAAIIDSLLSQWLPAVARPGDLVFVFISSHGTPAYKDIGALNSVVTYDTDLDHLFTTSLPMQNIARLMAGKLKKQHAFVVLDTCYAGGLGAPGKIASANVDPQMLLTSRWQLMLASSDSDERSWESKRYQNSVFTRQLIGALEKNPGYADFHAIFRLVRENVGQEVSADFAVRQTPKLAGRWSGRGLTGAGKTR